MDVEEAQGHAEATPLGVQFVSDIVLFMAGLFVCCTYLFLVISSYSILVFALQ